MSAKIGTLTGGSVLKAVGEKGKSPKKNRAVLVCSMVEEGLPDIFLELQGCGVAAARRAAEEETATVVQYSMKQVVPSRVLFSLREEKI
jgi:hypothetical protein